MFCRSYLTDFIKLDCFRPSYYEFQIDGGPLEKQKSSGLCISTGTGSTAWSYNICRLHPDATEHLLRVTRDVLRKRNQNSDLLVDEGLVEQGKSNSMVTSNTT